MDHVNALLSAGWYVGMRMTSSKNATAYSKVTGAAGDTYDHCINFHF